MKKIFTIFSILILLNNFSAQAQVPTCTADVPYFFVDLTGQPNGSWISPGHSRVGSCCGSTTNCTSFDVILDTLATMVNFNIASGAIPSGALYYQIDCGPEVPAGQPICISGVGPHHVTFCKPGNNQNTYSITSISRPIFPEDTYVRSECSKQLFVFGLEAPSVTWNSIYPGTPGQYNSYLNCVSGCIDPIYTPAVNAPAYIDYKICGSPVASECGYVSACDTVRIYNPSALIATTSPDSAQFCTGGGGVLLTALAIGGHGIYTYMWHDQNGNVVGTDSSYLATMEEIYTIEVRDELYDVPMCPAFFQSVPVIVAQKPVVNAGPDQTVCTASPIAYLSAIVQNASGGVWSGGNGTYSPDSTSLNLAYTPTAAELAAGQVILILTSTGAGGGCMNSPDTVIIHYPQLLTVALGSQSLSCDNSVTTLSPTVTGGITPYTYLWNTGSDSSTIDVGAGNFCVGIIDSLGCEVSACANVTAPPSLSLAMSSIDATSNGGSDGSATATVSGGTSPYTYLWTPGSQTTQTATGLSYGIYSVLVTDSNGCTINLSTVVNEPRCLSFQVTTSGTNILCNGDSTGTALSMVAGGTAPYTYSWNTTPPQSTTSVSNLSAGTYTLTVTESNGCVDVSNIAIFQPTQLNNTISHTNTTTVNGTDGSVTTNISGGISPYTYSWNTGDTTSSLTNVPEGVYSVTITDANGCTLTDSTSVYDPKCGTIALNVYSTSVTCAGGSNGTASAQILFGSPPYQYQWSNGATTQTITGLSAGVYTVISWEKKRCEHFANVIVTEPSPLSIALAPTNISCSDQNDGTIDLTVSGGTFPYTFSWSNGINVEDQYFLSNENYSVTVADANGCSASASTSITRPTPVVATGIKLDVICFSDSSGSVDASVSGGVPPYTYSWSNGASSEDISGLPAGEYILVPSDANGCSTASSFSILIDEPAEVSVYTFTINCPVPNSGVAEVIVAPTGGNNGPYQISFDNGTTYLSAGDYNEFLPIDSTYYVVIKDGNNCHSFTDTLTINPEVYISSISFATCFPSGTTTTPVIVIPAGGAGGPYQVSFDNGITFGAAGDYSGDLLIANTYNIVVKDSLGCTSVPSTIIIPDTITLNAASFTYAGGYNVSCNGMSDGNIDLTVTGGTAPYTYSWSNNSTTEDISGIIAGTYSVTVSDTNGCSISLNKLLTEPGLLTTTIITSDFNGFAVSCKDSVNATIDLSVNGGASPYSYNWSNGFVSEDMNSIGAGMYSLIVTDANGCIAKDTVLLNEPAALTLNTLVTNATCNGFSNGSIDLIINGGVSSYSQIWSTNATTEDVSGLLAGNYSVNVTDANGCMLTTSAVINEPAILSATTSSTNVLCNGGNTGTATVTASGGIIPYTYLWSGGQTTSMATNLSAGTYTITVTDSNACTFTSFTTVSEPTALTAIASSTDVLCNGGNTGTATIKENGGISPYSYLWSDGQTTPVASGLTAGTYSVTVTDNNACVFTTSVIVNEPTPLAALTSGTNALCNGGNTGTATVNASGGISPYSFLWSNGQTTAFANGLTAGTYNVTVTDNNACIFITPVTINQPTALTAVTSSTNTLCNGGNTGTATINVSGGVNPYSYLWSDGQTSIVASGLTANTYNVTVTDSNACTFSTSITVNQETTLTTSVTSTDVLCNGGNTGTATVNANGGVTPYSYLWSDGQTTAVASGLTTGTYNVIVTDSNACTITSSVTVNEPAILTASTSGTDVLCNGENSGTATVIANGGMAPYTYLWNNGQTISTATGLSEGIYTVTITDNNGCILTTSETIVQPDTITVSASQANASCSGLFDGTASLNVNGGIQPYIYQWSNNATTANITGLGAGNYSVIVTDSNGCLSFYAITITEPDPLSATISTTSVSCNGGNDGTAAVNVTGGTAPYYYEWNDGRTTESITGLTANVCTITVTDNNDCSLIASTIINQPDVISANFIISDVLCNNGKSGSIDMTTSGGTAPYSYLWSNGQTTEDATGLSATTYNVQITDNNQCTSDTSVMINEPAPLTVIAMVTDALCNGDNSGTATIAASGGTSPYAYQWSNSVTGPSISGLSSGSYTVTITDKNGCFINSSITINEPPALIPTISTTNVSCNGGNDGTASVAITGGTRAYSYLWDNGQTNSTIMNLCAGIYSVIITDANGCWDTVSSAIEEPVALTISTTAFETSCNGGKDGGAKVKSAGGTQPYTYLWSNGEKTSFITNLATGTYEVLVTDANGCSRSTSTTIREKSPVQIALNQTNPLCYGDKNGSINIIASGGITPYTYIWSNGDTTQNIMDLPAGMYIVNVHDKNRCVRSDTVIITQPDPLHAEISGFTFPNGYNVSSSGSSDGKILLSVTGGTNPYQYKWSNGNTVQNIEDLSVGNYSVTITDENGCTYLSSIALTGPYGLAMPNAISPNSDGKNEFFVVRGLDIYPDNEIQIFNRWGDEVYSQKGYMNDWNGKNKDGKILPEGTYFAILKVNIENSEQVLTGYIDLRK